MFSSFFPRGIACPPLVVTPPDFLVESGAVYGVQVTCQATAVARQRFNGAAAFQPRKAHTVSTGRCSSMSFNGAAAFQPRREYLRNFNERKGLNRLLRAARSMFLLNAVVGPMQDS